MVEEKLNPVHPGEVLLEEFLKPMGAESEPFGSGYRRSPAAYK